MSGYAYAKTVTVTNDREDKPRGTVWNGSPAARVRGFSGSAYRVRHCSGSEYFDTLRDARRYALATAKLKPGPRRHEPWAEIFRGYVSGVRAGFAFVASYERELIVE